MLQRNKKRKVEYHFDNGDFPLKCSNDRKRNNSKLELFLDGAIPKIQFTKTGPVPFWTMNRGEISDICVLLPLVYQQDIPSLYGGLPCVEAEHWSTYEFFFFEGELYVLNVTVDTPDLYKISSRRPEEDWEKLNEILSSEENP